MDTVRTAHDKMLEEKRTEVLETVRQCMEATHTARLNLRFRSWRCENCFNMADRIILILAHWQEHGIQKGKTL